MATYLDRVLSMFMLTALAATPIFFIPAPWLSLVQAKMLLLVVLVLLGVLTWAKRAYFSKQVHVPVHSILVAGLLVLAAYALSAVGARGASYSLVGSGIEVDTLAAVTIWFALVFLVASSFSSNLHRLAHAYRALFAGGAILVVFQLLHLFWPDAFSLGGYFAGATANLVGSWHDLSIVLGVLVIGAVFLTRSGLLGVWRFVALGVGILSMVFLMLQNMRDVWIGLGAVAALAILCAAVRSWRSGEGVVRSVTREWLLVLLLVVSLCGAVFGTFIHEKLPESIRVVHIEVRPSWQGTLIVGRQSLDQPGQLLFGSGPNTFVKEWNRYKPINVNETPFWNADFGAGVGTIPTSFVTTGLAGILAWAAFLLAVLWSALRFLRAQISPSADTRERAVAYSAFFLSAFLIVYTPSLAVVSLTFIFLGLFVGGQLTADRFRAYSVGFQSRKAMLNLGLVLLLTLAIAAASIGIIRVILSDIWVNRSVIGFNATSDAVAARGLIEGALKIAPRNDRAHRAAVELGIVEFQQIAASGEASEELQKKLQESLSTTIQHGLFAVSINAASYQNWLTLAGLYADLAGQNVEGAYENARAAYARSLEANPTNPLPLLRLAQLELIRENTDTAQQYLAQAVQVKRDFAAAFFLDSQINASKQQFDVALAEAAEAVRLVPDDVSGWFNLGLIAYTAGEYDTARQAFERAVGIQGTYANALYFLGLSYYQLKDQDKALDAFRKVLELNPDNADLKKIVDDLLAGKPLQLQSAQTRPQTPPARPPQAQPQPRTPTPAPAPQTPQSTQ